MIFKCPICQSTENDVLGTCRCGYNFTEDKISDKDKTVTYFKKLKETKHWIDPARFTEKLHKFQQREKGEARVGVRGGWRYEDTAELIKEQTSIVFYNIKLAIYSEIYPELLNCGNRAQALQLSKRLKPSGYISEDFETYDVEDDLQEYLKTNWETTAFGEEWEIIESPANVGDAGEIDLLAHHRKEDCWLVVELKRDKISDKTVGQILRYMGWIKENLANNKVVRGIVIVHEIDKKLNYSASVLRNVEVRYYKINLKFITKEELL